MPASPFSWAFRGRHGLGSRRERLLTSAGRRNGALNALAGLLLALFALSCLAQLRANDWNTDMDYLMYHGGRILHGELPWVKEYHDRMPVAHYFFILPALGGSIRLWQLLSIGVIVTTGILSYRPLVCMLRGPWALERSSAGSIAFLTLALMVYSYAALPSGISIFTPFAASLFTLALFLESHPCGSECQRHRLWSWRSLWAALLAAIAVSMRPYFLLPALLIVPWSLARTGVPLFGGMALARQLRWILSLAAMEALFDFLPYGLTGHWQAAVAAVRLLAQPFVPASRDETLRRQLKDLAETDPIVFIGLSSGIVLVAVMIIILARGKILGSESRLRTQNRAQIMDVIFLCILMPGSLWLTIFSKHYYEHYLHHYIPFAMLSFALLLSLVLRHSDGLSLPRGAALLMTGLMLVQVLFLAKRHVHASLVGLFRTQMDQRLADYVAIESSKNRERIKAEGFLHPYSMYIHWKAEQSRHGFPNPFNTQLILRGDWKGRVVVPPYFSMPVDAEGYCDKLSRQGPRFVFVYADDPVLFGCMTGHAAGSYDLRERLRVLSPFRPLLVFQRR